MHVRLAKTAGFCMGVRRAMAKVLETAAKSDGRLVTFGPLIHNAQVTQLLEERSVRVVKRPEDVEAGDEVAIRAHGVPPETREALRSRGASICDATCPHVGRAQGIVKRAASEGRDVIIVGDRGHAEVIGLLGYAKGRGHVVERLEDMDSLPPLGRVAVVAQTTQAEDVFAAVVERARALHADCEAHNTICDSTANRQQEAAELSDDVDVMVVVGGRHSANTVRLAQIVRERGKPVVHVEDAAELREEDFREFRVVGVTAGASTPNWVIEEVVTRVEGFYSARAHPLLWVPRELLDLLVRAGCLVALGAGGLAFASTQMVGLPFDVLHFLIPVAYVFSMMNWNAYAEFQAGEMVDRARASLFRRHGRLLTVLSAAFAGASLAMAAAIGVPSLFVLLVSAILGVLYTIPVLPRGPFRRYRRLKDLPGSRNILFAAAIGVVTVVLPLVEPILGADGSPLPYPLLGALAPLLFASTLAFVRSVALDIKDMQSDLFAGRDTIPVVIGRGATKVLLAVLLGLSAASILAGSLLGWLSPRALWQLPTVGLTSGILFLFYLRGIPYGLLFRTLLDLGFLAAGLAALGGRLTSG